MVADSSTKVKTYKKDLNEIMIDNNFKLEGGKENVVICEDGKIMMEETTKVKVVCRTLCSAKETLEKLYTFDLMITLTVQLLLLLTPYYFNCNI